MDTHHTGEPPDGRRVPLIRILLALALTLLAGLLLKQPCASGSWADGRPYTRFCYSDIVPLYRGEQLAAGKVPYLHAHNEYPVGTGMLMWLTSLPARSEGTFFDVNVLVLGGAAVWVTILLYGVVGSRALYFALAPTLALTGFLNWDLVPVLLATAGTVSYLHQRDGPSGALLGAGAATKVFPGFLLVPFALDRIHAGRRGSALRLVAGAAVVRMSAVIRAITTRSSWIRSGPTRSGRSTRRSSGAATAARRSCRCRT